jgi:hypothetical protein
MVKIDSREKWNDTGIDLVAGRRYRFNAEGKWKDWFIECDADGFSNVVMNLSNWAKRVRAAPWFRLIGAVDKNLDDPIILGVTGEFVAPATGVLWAFANDAKFAYGNNHGSVDLSIEEITE